MRLHTHTDVILLVTVQMIIFEQWQFWYRDKKYRNTHKRVPNEGHNMG